jgi:F0F1-type ATP synthase membrane subunit b/b'
MSTPDKNPSPVPVPAATQSDDASLHKIREILVGPTSRAIDERLDEFRKQLDVANQKRQQEIGTRLEALEKQLRSGLEHQDAKNSAALEHAHRTFESKLDELRRHSDSSSERISRAQAETRQWIEREMESLRARLDHTFASLRAELVDRQSMASLFSEMSLRVAGESNAPIDTSRPDDIFEIMTGLRNKT